MKLSGDCHEQKTKFLSLKGKAREPVEKPFIFNDISHCRNLQFSKLLFLR